MRRRIRLIASGSNGAGQLGIGHTEDVSDWVSCRFADSMRTSMKDYTTDEVPGTISMISSGAGHSLLLMQEDHEPYAGPSSKFSTVWTSGSNGHKQLGRACPVVEAANTHTCWEKHDIMSSVRQSGLPTDPAHHYVPKHVACSWTSSLICLEHWKREPGGDWCRLSDVIISFGTNDFGELGAGSSAGRGPSTSDFTKDVHLVNLQHHNGDSGTMIIRKLEASHRNVVCIVDYITQDGNELDSSTSLVYGWGAARHGQLSLKTAVIPGLHLINSEPKPKPTERSPHMNKARTPDKQTKTSRPELAIRRGPGDVRMRKSAFPLSHLEPVHLDVASLFETTGGTRVEIQELAVGASHIILQVAIGLQKEIVGMGSNAKSQLDFRSILSPDDGLKWGAVGCTWNGTFLAQIEPVKRVLATGTNTHGQLGQGTGSPVIKSEDMATPPRTAVAFSTPLLQEPKLICGSEHVIVLEHSARRTKVWIWGWNEHGNLGLRDIEDRWCPVQVLLGDQVEVTGGWAGCGTSWLCVDEPINPEI
jgi:protein ATS1